MINLFLRRALFFVLPIVLLMYPLDYIISKYLAKNDYLSISAGEYSVWNDIYAKKIDVDVAIYGGSRAWTQINAPMISDSLNKSSYNFGVDGHNFQLQYLRHLEYLKYNSPPKTIILSVDFATLQKRKDLYNYSQLLPYMLWNDTIYKYTKDYEGFSNTDYKIPLIRYIGEFSLFLKSTLNKDRKKRIQGYSGRSKNWNNDFNNAQKKIKKQVYKTDSSTVSLFNDFLRTCKKSDINVILVYTPFYHEGFDFIEKHQEIINSFKEIANKYQLSFIDYSKDSICYDKQFFYNSAHLNKKGADLFTNKLIDTLNEYYLLDLNNYKK